MGKQTVTATSKKKDSAEQAVRERFRAIEAALEDVKPSAFGVLPYEVAESDSSLRLRYRNRLRVAFLLISHLRDDARRLGKILGVDAKVITDFVQRSLPVTLCVRSGDTTKHGLGGRSKNATVANGFVLVRKVPSGSEPAADDDCLIVGMALADRDHGVFHSHVILEAAMKDWVEFLKTELSLDLMDWAERVISNPARVVTVGTEGSVVPPGSDGCQWIPKGALRRSC